MLNERHRHEQIIRFWRAVELFSPQAIPKPDVLRAVAVLDPARPLPWDPHHRPDRTRVEAGWEWQHTVYLGTYSIARLYDVLDHRFAPDRESFDPRPPGDSALAAITVDHCGVMVPDSGVLSGCAWATGRAFRPGPDDPRWLHGLTDAENTWRAEVDALFAAEGDVEDEAENAAREIRITAALCWALAEMTRKSICLLAEVDSSGIRVTSRRIKHATANQPVGDFLNSFFLDDLDLVAARAASGDLNPGLTSYLTETRHIPITERIDVQQALPEVLRHTGPDKMPPGRWPSNPDHPLALSQQLAVDLVTGGHDQGIFAVNGPPGTGKTTMLREIFASLVVTRASGSRP